MARKTKKIRGKTGKSVAQAKFYDNVSSIEKFIETSKLKYLNKFFLIEKISPTSKLFFYFGLIGSILIILSLFIPDMWIACWIHVFILIILLGFIFAKPDTRYNFVLVLGAFTFLMFIPSIYRYEMVSATLDVNNSRTYTILDATTGSRFDVDVINYEAKLKPKIKDEYTIHDLRASIVVISRSYDECHMYFEGYVDNPYDLDYETRSDLASYYNTVTNPTYKGEICQDWILDWESILEPYLKKGYSKANVRNIIIDGTSSFSDIKGYYINLDEKHERILEYYNYLLYRYGDEIGKLTETEVDYNQEWRDNVTSDADDNMKIFDITGFMDSVNGLSENPFDNIDGYISNFMDVLNWIVFLAILAYSGAAVASGIQLNIGDAAKKLAQIGLAIAVMTLIYSLYDAGEISVTTVWDTIGNAWTDLMSSLGLGMLDSTTGEVIITANSTIDGIYRIIPIVFSFTCFGLAYGLRKTDLKSVIFAKTVSDDNVVEIKISSFSISTGVILSAMIVYVVGYFLVTADPTVVIDPTITIIFYIGAVVVLLLIGNKFLIVSKEKDVKSFIWRTAKWTVFGLMGLFLWFGVFQPAMFQLNFTDSPNTLLVLSQGKSIFETDFLQQLFLVATPETLIFQILFLGIGNRIYFYLKKTRISKDTIKKMKQERWALAIKFKSIKINPNSSSNKNMRNIAKAVVLKQKIEELGQLLEEKKVEKVPISFFIFSTVISSLIGSFFFSWYHSFRRGMSFAQWWQNPMYGLTYFGAGFFLCLIAFFSWPSSILVHAFNNIIAIFMMGG